MYNPKTIFIVACGGMLLFGVTLITLGAIVPDLREKHNLDAATVGALFAILPLGILMGSLVFGYFCDKYGYKGVLMASSLSVALGLLGIAVFTSVWALQGAVFFFGLGGGCINGATNALVADISTTHKRANLSLLGVFFALGALGIPLVLGLLEGRVGFKAIMIAMAMLAAIGAVLTHKVEYPPKKDFSALPIRSVVKALSSKFLFLIGFFLFFQSSLEAIVHNWITTYLSEHHFMRPDQALYALTLNVAGMAVMRLLMGGVLRTTDDGKILHISMFILIASAVLLLTASSSFLLLLAVTLLGAGMAAGFPVMYAMAGRAYAHMPATAFSFILVVALLGNMVLNFVMGWVASRFGITQVATFILIECIAMLVLAVMVVRLHGQMEVENH